MHLCHTKGGVLLLAGGLGVLPAPADQNADRRDGAEASVALTRPSASVEAATGPAAPENTCSPIFQLPLSIDAFAHFFDADREVSYLFVPRTLAIGDFMLRVEVHANLNVTSTVLPIGPRWSWLAQDLDQDGEIELVLQWGSTLEIYSAPDWRIRSQLPFPGMNVSMYPVAVNIDEDPQLELYLTPRTFGGTARAVLVDYDAVRDTFVVIADVPAPYRTFGNPAVGDFDQDGRMEFISGNEWDGGGYGLFEYDGDSLRFIDQVIRFTDYPSSHSATACRPKPDGLLYALAGRACNGFFAYLLKPTGDNQFELVHTFHDGGLSCGGHTVYAADIDCDGLDELLMNLVSTQTWEWDETVGDFVPGCLQAGVVPGRPVQFQSTDLDQDGALEWSGVRADNLFLTFEDPRCALCCPCHGDPLCDSVRTDVRDVVACIAVVIRGVAPTFDPSCPRERTDVDCSGITDILDIVHTIAVAFGGASLAAEFCPKPSCNASP